MTHMKKGGPTYKKRIAEILKTKDMDCALDDLEKMPVHKIVNPLFSLLHSTEEMLKWAAVTAMGQVVVKIADKDMESARVIMRRLMWNLNDESGGIGWGSPEAMGEILACHESLSKEYVRVLISYARPDGNFLELEMLQRGLLWGIGRLVYQKPDMMQRFMEVLIPYLGSKDPIVRGLAAWIMCALKVEKAKRYLERLLRDPSEIDIYVNRSLTRYRISDLAMKALKQWQRANHFTCF